MFREGGIVSILLLILLVRIGPIGYCANNLHPKGVDGAPFFDLRICLQR